MINDQTREIAYSVTYSSCVDVDVYEPEIHLLQKHCTAPYDT